MAPVGHGAMGFFPVKNWGKKKHNKKWYSQGVGKVAFPITDGKITTYQQIN